MIMEVHGIHHINPLYLRANISDNGLRTFYRRLFDRHDGTVSLEDYQKEFLERFNFSPRINVVTQETKDTEKTKVDNETFYFPLTHSGPIRRYSFTEGERKVEVDGV